MKTVCFILAAYGILSVTSAKHHQDSLPARVCLQKGDQCPFMVSDNFSESIASVVNELLNEKYGPPCTCGNGVFQRAIYLDMSNSSMQCPSNWTIQDSEVRGCRSHLNTSGCSSAVFSTSTPYNHVCAGKINGYQRGTPDAFYLSSVRGIIKDINGPYMDGVSLTYGAQDSRKHIWTFTASPLYSYDSMSAVVYHCECTNTMFSWNYHLPSFVGTNYFCESGNLGPGFDFNQIYADDPLWDGQGCPSTSSCCELNRPPWFCVPLPQTTAEDLEIRICKDEAKSNEDIIISLIDIYTSTI